MSIWHRVNLETDRWLLNAGDVEFFESPSGIQWWRRRSTQEALELNRLMTEHHPNLDEQPSSAGTPNNG